MTTAFLYIDYESIVSNLIFSGQRNVHIFVGCNFKKQKNLNMSAHCEFLNLFVSAKYINMFGYIHHHIHIFKYSTYLRCLIFICCGKYIQYRQDNVNIIS